MNSAEKWLEYCAAELTRAGVFFGHGTDNAHDEAAWLVLHVLGAPLDGSYEHWDAVLSESQQGAAQALLERRIKERLPLAYLTGTARFCGLDFVVTPAVLVPRSPVAELIAERFSPWLDAVEKPRVLDMCTGSACIAIAVASSMPAAVIDAVDISAAALEIAAINVERHGLAERVRLVQADLFAGLEGPCYDLIVANPPYVAADVIGKLPPEYRAEPAGGLLAGEDGLDIVLKILDAATDFLKQRGILVVEVGESARALAELLPRAPFLWLEFSHGGDGVFLLEYDQLRACRPHIRSVLEQREHV